MKTPKQLVKEWVELRTDHDLNKLMVLYHEDATHIQVATGHSFNGREAIRKDIESFFEKIPDSFTKIENLFEDGSWAILEWSAGGTFKPTGRTFTLKGSNFFQIVDGKIKFQRGYWDNQTLLNQVGLPV